MRSISRLPAADARRAAEHAAGLLARNPRVLLVYTFGSSVHGPGPVRDVDVAVLTAPRVSLDELLRARADLVAATGAPIDLISLNDASIALAHEVVAGGVCLFARTPDIETEFVTRARTRYWDFKPYRDEQWRLAGQRAGERRRGA
jgi:predicted nucleotidyltransferase